MKWNTFFFFFTVNLNIYFDFFISGKQTLEVNPSFSLHPSQVNIKNTVKLRRYKNNFAHSQMNKSGWHEGHFTDGYTSARYREKTRARQRTFHEKNRLVSQWK